MPVAVRVDTKGLRDLAGRFHRAMPEHSGRFRDAMKAIGRDGVKEAKARAPRRSGKLAGSIGFRTDGGGATWKLTIFIGVPYGVFVIKKTKPHWIFPRRKKYLHFIGRHGGEVFSRGVFHPGTKRNPFMDEAVEAVDLEGRIRKIAGQVVSEITR